MRNTVGSVLVALLVLSVAPQVAFAGPGGGGRLTVTVLSGRPDTVTGGNALVRVAAPARVPLDRIRVRVDGRDVTGEFRPDPDVHGVTAPGGLHDPVGRPDLRAGEARPRPGQCV